MIKVGYASFPGFRTLQCEPIEFAEMCTIISVVATSEILAEDFSVSSVCFIEAVFDFSSGVSFHDEVDSVGFWEC